MTPWLQDADCTLYHGDVLTVLRDLPAESVDCCVTSPPYWGLRDYGQEGQLGLEPTPEEYVTRMVEVFREVRRLLAPHGTVWLNLGDSYVSQGGPQVPQTKQHVGSGLHGTNRLQRPWGGQGATPLITGSPNEGEVELDHITIAALKPKDLVGIPWHVAFALQADGWYLRSDIIWAKPNPMPESVTDRPTKAHEYVFLLAKQPRYFFDQEAVREPAEWARWGDQTNGKHEGQSTGAGWIGSASKEELQRRSTKTKKPDGWDTGPGGHGTVHREGREKGAENYVEARGRNIRSVWEIATQPYPEAHFATFPEELARRCIAAGCPEQVCRVCGKARERIVDSQAQNSDERRQQGIAEAAARGISRNRAMKDSLKPPLVSTLGFTDCGHSDYRPGLTLDPFIGSGTVAYVARKLGRHAVGIDLNSEYLELAAKRLQQQSLFADAGT